MSDSRSPDRSIILAITEEEQKVIQLLRVLPRRYRRVVPMILTDLGTQATHDSLSAPPVNDQ